MNTTLGALLSDARPGFACGKADDSGIFQFRMHNVSRTCNISLEKRRRVPIDANRKIGNFLVESGDVLFNSTNSPENTGKSILIPELDEPAVFSNHFLRLRTAGDKLASSYLWRWLQWQYSRGTFLGLTRKWVNQATVSRADLLGLSIDVPNLSEQARVTSILDEVDAGRSKRRTQLAHLDNLERSSFLETFGDLEAQSHVTDTLLGQKGAIRTGPFGSQLLHEEFVDEGVAVLGLDNVVDNDFKWAKRRFITPAKFAKLSRYTVHPGDVLISIMGTVGRCVVVPKGIPTSINTKHICAISLDQSVAHPAFVRAAFLWHPETRRYLAHETKGAIMAGLNMGIIKGMPLPLPQIGAQTQFADKVSAIHAERDRVTKALEVDDELFAALQQRAFRGEL